MFFVYAQTMDPYRDDPDLPEEMHQIGRVFVDPNEGIVVALSDLPAEARAPLEDTEREADR